jgi:DnaJ-class molecular chaperone
MGKINEYGQSEDFDEALSDHFAGVNAAMTNMKHVDCPACEGQGIIDLETTKIFDGNGKHVSDIGTYEDCEWCEGDGQVTPDRAAEWHAAKKAGLTKSSEVKP